MLLHKICRFNMRRYVPTYIFYSAQYVFRGFILSAAELVNVEDDHEQY